MGDLYKIGQVSELCEVPIKTLRYYEEEKLIKPVKVDIYTGYRYYDDNCILQIYKVKFLRELGFSIKEICDFNEQSINDKIKEIESQIAHLKDNQRMLSFLNKQKGEKIMKNFINDKDVIGKWKYIASTSSKERYLEGDFKIENSSFIKNLYFLPEGRGYWIFERWTKGMLLHFRGDVYTYEVQDGKLFLTVIYDNKKEVIFVFEKVDSKEYISEEIVIKDNTDLPFVMDKKALGLWESLGYIRYEDKDNYNPNDEKKEGMILKQMTFNPNGEVIIEYSKSMNKEMWTKGKILNKNLNTSSDYIVKTIDGEEYLIMDWKSGDYVYQGDIKCCYVFKKVK